MNNVDGLHWKPITKDTKQICCCHRMAYGGHEYEEGLCPKPYFEYKAFKTSVYPEKSIEFLTEVIETAKRDAKKNNSTILLFKMLEELGEYGTVKAGHKTVEESPKEEMVDIIITALSLYALEGGDMEHLAKYGSEKLSKYEAKYAK